MITNIVWTGIAYHSMEHCVIDKTSHGVVVQSTIVGYCEDQLYTVRYVVQINQLWETYFAEISVHCNNDSHTVKLEKKNGQWWLNAVLNGLFSNCVDIDISLTPFTNTLPIRRMVFINTEAQLTDVIYVDILKGQVLPVKQFYYRLSSTSFLYENFDKQFTAQITITDDGLVAFYPGLFTMACKQITS